MIGRNTEKSPGDSSEKPSPKASMKDAKKSKIIVL